MQRLRISTKLLKQIIKNRRRKPCAIMLLGLIATFSGGAGITSLVGVDQALNL
jgi:hypothetical protein